MVSMPGAPHQLASMSGFMLSDLEAARKSNINQMPCGGDRSLLHDARLIWHQPRLYRRDLLASPCDPPAFAPRLTILPSTAASDHAPAFTDGPLATFDFLVLEQLQLRPCMFAERCGTKTNMSGELGQAAPLGGAPPLFTLGLDEALFG